MTDPHTDWDRLGRYVAGESSPAERAEVERWLAQNPGEARALAALDAAARQAAPANVVDVERALQRLKQRRAAAPGRPWRYAMLAAAAIAVLAIGLRFMRQPASAPLAPRTYAAAPGVRDSITLGDRAQVILAPGSRLVAENDNVVLTGRAFFTVTHDPARPLTVRAGAVTVRDVGTRFTVEQEPAGSVRVVVTEGAVDVSPSSGAATTRVGAGDIALITAARVDVRRGAATADDLAWTRGRLVFHDATLASVLADLERWYGVAIQVRDPALLSRHFSGEFENLPADRVLQTLALALGTRLDRVADTTWLGNVPPAR